MHDAITPGEEGQAPGAGRLGWSSRADPFFWLVVLALVPAVVVASLMDAERPSWALRSAAVHRLEVGLAVFLGGYVVALALANAFRGRTFGRLGLPGGAEFDPRDPALQEASEGAAEFESEARGGLRDLTEAVSLMNDRVSKLEAPAPGAPGSDPRPDGPHGVSRRSEQGNVES